MWGSEYVIHKLAKADMTIAHSSDDVSTPPPVPPGPPAIMIHAITFEGVYVRVEGAGLNENRVGQCEGGKTEVDLRLVYMGSKKTSAMRPC